MTKISVLLAAAVLLVAPLAPVGAVSAAPAPVARESAVAQERLGSERTAPAARKAKPWKCGRWTHGISQSMRWCVRFRSIKPVVRQDGKDLLHNNFKKPKKMHCSLSKGTTLGFSVEGTVEAEAGVVFAKAKTSVTAGVSGSTTTTSATGAEFRVKGKGWAYCARGHAAFRVKGRTSQHICGGTKCIRRPGNKVNTLLPSSPFFEIGPGRDINWKRFLPKA